MVLAHVQYHVPFSLPALAGKKNCGEKPHENEQMSGFFSESLVYFEIGKMMNIWVNQVIGLENEISVTIFQSHDLIEFVTR